MSENSWHLYLLTSCPSLWHQPGLQWQESAPNFPTLWSPDNPDFTPSPLLPFGGTYWKMFETKSWVGGQGVFSMPDPRCVEIVELICRRKHQTQWGPGVRMRVSSHSLVDSQCWLLFPSAVWKLSPWCLQNSHQRGSAYRGQSTAKQALAFISTCWMGVNSL